jgi:hypothetical protein
MRLIFLSLVIVVLTSCSHESNRSTVTISSATKGLIKNVAISAPLYITNSLDEKDIPSDALKIHQGHFLSVKNTKDQNVSILKKLEEDKFHLVNLSLEDIAILESQEIKLTDFKKLIFLNSTISDVTRDDLYANTNVLPYYIFEDAVFIGLSDHVVDKKLNTSRFLFNDYVFSILKIKKVTKDKTFKSYIIIHNLGSEINEIMDRLPPTFINSLAN